MRGRESFAEVSAYWDTRMPDVNYRKLSELTAQVHKIGANYNQVVRLMHLYTAEKSVRTLLQELIRQTKELTALQEETVSLTIDYRER